MIESLSEIWKLFKTFEWEGIKWLSPFSCEFKFIDLKSMRGDSMTSSTIKKFESRWHWNSFRFCFAFCLFLTHEMSGTILCQTREKERRNMTLEPTGILKVIWTLKLRGSIENYLQKENKPFRQFCQNNFFWSFYFCRGKMPIIYILFFW